MEVGMKTGITAEGGRCTADGGTLKFVRCDHYAVYFECDSCGRREKYTFRSKEESENYIEHAKRDMLGKIGEGIADWQKTQWERLQKDLVDFINRHAPLEYDMELQIARIACITNGFNLMDDQKYKSCKARFKVVDKIYKSELKRLKKLSKHPELSETMEGYQQAREKYIKLKNRYLETKFIWKIFFSVLKVLKRFVIPV